MRGYLIAVAAAIAVIIVAPIDTRMNTSPRLDKIDESLVAFNGALLNMQKNTDGALERMLESIDALSGNLADTKVATQTQITDMRDSIEAVKLVATTLPPQEPQIGDVIPDEDEETSPAPTPFATLDVNSSSDIRVLADRVAALERQVDELQVLKSQYQAKMSGTSGGSSGGVSSSSAYQTVTTPVYSGGSSGTLSNAYYAPTVYSEPVYSAPIYSSSVYSAPATTTVRRGGLFGRRIYSSSSYGTCRVVNGQVICN